MAISRVTAVWTGFTGAPGYTNFFFDAFGAGDEVNAEVNRVFTFFNGIISLLPEDVTIQVQPEAAILDEASGALISYANADTTPTANNGIASGSYSAPSGALVSWQTDAVARGRRLRGRTFLVPLANSAYEDDGTLASGTVNTINNAAGNLMGDGTGPALVIWSRPRDGAGGSIGTVTDHRVPDMAAVLRSRRD